MTRRRAWRSALVAVVGVLSTSGCEDDESPSAQAPSAEDGATTTEAACRTDDGTAAELESLMTDDLPSGYEVAPDVAEDTGPVDLELAAFSVGDPDERDLLSDLQFRRGYQRLWYGPDGRDDLIVYVYEFCDQSGAAAYVRATRDRLVSPLWGSEEIDVDGLPEDAVGLLQESEPETESFVAILRADKPFYVEIGAYGILSRESLDTLTARALALSDAQIAALP